MRCNGHSPWADRRVDFERTQRKMPRGNALDGYVPFARAFGTDVQKRHYLPRMASGELIGAIAMTEPGTGSDLQSIRTRAEDEGDHYVLNGSKIFITNGYLSDVVIVVAKTCTSGKGSADTSLLLVDASASGFTKGKPLKKISARGLSP